MRPKPGLQSVHEARAQRKRSKYGRPGPNALLVGIGGLVLVLLGYWFFAQRSLKSAQQALLAQQRAVNATVGAEWFPLRDRIEALTVEAGGAYPGDLVDPATARWDFRSAPGIYLRLRVEGAKDVASVRRAAQDSLRDGFTACLLREPNNPLARGEPDAGAFSEHPWNLRQAYRATRVMTDEWANEVTASGDELRLRVFVQQYEKAKASEIPLAIDIMRRSQFFLLVLDEDADEARALSDGGVITPETLQLVPHFSRVFIVDLRAGKTVVRLRRKGTGEKVLSGAIVDPETRDAVTRQVNNCALARSVWMEIAPPTRRDAVGDAGVEGGSLAR